MDARERSCLFGGVPEGSLLLHLCICPLFCSVQLQSEPIAVHVLHVLRSLSLSPSAQGSEEHVWKPRSLELLNVPLNSDVSD